MPVPVSVSNPDGKGSTAYVNKSLPSAGGLFANLGVHSVQAGLAGQQAEQADIAREASRPGNSQKESAPKASTSCEHSVICNGLEFKYIGEDGLPLPGPACLKGTDLKLATGSRMLLIGANGAGKTTLLKVLAGKHMVGKEMVNILGSPPFYETHLTTAGQLSYIGGNWERDVAFAGYSIPLAGDFPASQMLDSIHHVDPARRKKLIEVLDIDEEWRMHLVSDGQRRRVQIACGLLKPADVLLLDEVTTDLDVLVREDLMNFLKEESEQRGCTIIYITHIFDGLEDWPSHLGFLADGKFESVVPASEVPELKQGMLMELVEKFLLRHKAARDARIKEGLDTPHPETRQTAYIANNGYGAGRMNTTVAER